MRVSVYFTEWKVCILEPEHLIKITHSKERKLKINKIIHTLSSILQNIMNYATFDSKR